MLGFSAVFPSYPHDIPVLSLFYAHSIFIAVLLRGYKAVKSLPPNIKNPQKSIILVWDLAYIFGAIEWGRLATLLGAIEFSKNSIISTTYSTLNPVIYFIPQNDTNIGYALYSDLPIHQLPSHMIPISLALFGLSAGHVEVVG